MKTLRQITVLALITLCGYASKNQTTVGGPRDTQAGPRVQVWLTTTDRRKQLARETDVVFHDATGASATIDIDAGKRYQTLVGFGAAITDASAWLIRARMNAAQREATNARTMSVQCNGRLFQYTMPARSVATFVWAEI
jgi:glucosylceramidase